MKRLFVIATLFFFSSFHIVSAEIVSPYVVDEKSQVMFGDSESVTVASTTYQGLENYTHDYVDDYLHITFTYTHGGCCTASSPPKLYVTGHDPQSTTSPEVRNNSHVYKLSSQPTYRTDVYSYDVQFDTTGYTVKVNASNTDFTWVYTATTTEVTNFHRDIPGLTTSDWAALANDYPNSNEFSMAFTPLQIYDTPVVPIVTTTPVIIVPGITASVLKDGNSEKWPNTLLMGLSFEDLYLNDLILESNGENIGSIDSDSIIRTLIGHDFFDGLFSSLNSAGYIEDESSFEFPYDWRLDISTLATELKERIDKIKMERGVDKVDLVAHSMGGLLVKQYLKDYGGDSIDKFVDVGTPHTGAPKAFKILNYGDNFGASILFGLLGLNEERVKIISQNMPSVYELLPSDSYFESDPFYIFNGTDGNKRLSFAETKAYLKAQSRNAALVDRAEAFHQEIDSLDPAAYGVDTYNIVGCGTPTIGKFYVLKGGSHPIYNIGYVTGDGTVPLVSAEAMPAGKTYFLKRAKHALMPSAAGAKELIVGILVATSSIDLDISSYTDLVDNKTGCGFPDGRVVSLHSPIDLYIYDSSGNHVGPDTNGDIENNIPGVEYDVIDGNKFAFLPDGTDYTIKGFATASGTFDLRIQEIVNGEVINTSIWTDVALSETTQIQFSIHSDTPTKIALDDDNDGTYESLADISTSFAGLVESTGKIAQMAEEQKTSSSKSPPAFSSKPVAAANRTGEVLGAATPNAAEREIMVREAEAKLIAIMEDFIILLQLEIKGWG